MPKETFESRRSFLQLLPAAALVSFGFAAQEQSPHPETTHLISKDGFITAYKSDELMEEVVANRYGFNSQLFFNSEVRAQINSLTSVTPLRTLEHQGERLLQNKTQFNSLLERMGVNLFLFVLQGITDDTKTRPLLIAPDTFNFSSAPANIFIGKSAYLTAQQYVDVNGNLAYYQSPKVFTAWVMDVRSHQDHLNHPEMLTDADPSTIAATIKAYWDHEAGIFRSQNGSPVAKLPKISLELLVP